MNDRSWSDRMMEIVEREGWTVDTQLDLLLEYIGNQQSPEALLDFLAEKRSGEESSRKFYKTRVVVTVISERPLVINDLSDVHYQITDGDCVGSVKLEEIQAIGGRAAATEMMLANSDPGFFNLTGDGQDIEEEQDD